jgi:ribosomal protein S18 acetylase RimI-like enzyme
VGISIRVGKPSEVQALIEADPEAAKALLPRNKLSPDRIRLIAYDDETKAVYGFLEADMGGIFTKKFYSTRAAVLNILVTTEARNYGIAEKLIRDLLGRKCVENRTVILFCPRKNPAVTALAEKCGFKYSSNDDDYNCYVKLVS